jgi:hypothetical protein
MKRTANGSAPTSNGLAIVIMAFNLAPFVCYVVPVASLIGCADHRASTDTDAWFTAPDPESKAEDARSVPASQQFRCGLGY